MKKISLPKVLPESVLYHVLCVVQRFSLLILFFTAVIRWAFLIIITTIVPIIGDTKPAVRFEHPQALNETIRQASQLMMRGTYRWAIYASVFTVALLLLPRVRKHEKRLVIDSVIVIVFSLGCAILAEPIVRTVIQRYLTF